MYANEFCYSLLRSQSPSPSSLHVALFPSVSCFAFSALGGCQCIGLYAWDLTVLLLCRDMPFLRLSLVSTRHCRGPGSWTPLWQSMEGWCTVCCIHCCSPQCFWSPTFLSPKDTSCYPTGLNKILNVYTNIKDTTGFQKLWNWPILFKKMLAGLVRATPISSENPGCSSWKAQCNHSHSCLSSSPATPSLSLTVKQVSHPSTAAFRGHSCIISLLAGSLKNRNLTASITKAQPLCRQPGRDNVHEVISSHHTITAPS